MKTKARKAYEKQMPRWEMLLRDRIANEKQLLEQWKCELADALEWAERENMAEHNEKDLRCTEENLAFIRESIHAQKHLIQFLKNGLPQRRLDGVMARCPHCGAKKGQTVGFRTKDGWIMFVPSALTAYDYKDEGVVIAQCCKCGASIKLDNQKYTVQDAIDAWNRRA